MVCSGQAVVLYRLAIMSKDGDWILREDAEATQHVLQVLAGYGAHYRFGAPLDVRWLSGGWSSHLQFQHQGLRVRTDFFTRPPRLGPEALARQWSEQSGNDVPLVGLCELAEMKKTNREKDYVVIGELARLMTEPRDQLLYSRSARDLTELARAHPDLVRRLQQQRPLLSAVARGREQLEARLDAERRELIRANELRLNRAREASAEWARAWPEVQRETERLPLPRAHEMIIERADGILPHGLQEENDGPAAG
jgi:hypothetical protein